MARRKCSWIVVCIMSLLCGMFACNILQPELYKPPNDLRQIIHLTKGDTMYYKYVWQTSWSYDSTTIFRTVVDSGTWRYIPYLFDSHTPRINPSFYRSQCYFGTNDCSFLEIRDSSQYKRTFISSHDDAGTILKLPVRNGTRWHYGGDFYEIQDADTSIFLENRRYDHAIYVTSVNSVDSIAAEYFIAPRIGIVMEKHQTNDYYGKAELISKNF